MRVLVTGATGNVGGAVLRALEGAGHDVRAGTRDPDAVRGRPELAGAVPVAVDFERGIVPDEPFDAAFLLRPPALGDPAPLEAFARALRPVDPAVGTKLVFLSVRGVEDQPWLPHARIEKALAGLDAPHVFVRAGYFMENLVTTLADDVRADRGIRLPAGDLALDWVAVDDVGAMAAAALVRDVGTDRLEVSNARLTGFAEALAAVNRACGIDLEYVPVSLARYLVESARRRRGLGYTAILLLLHWVPRFVARTAPPPADPSDVRATLGREPEGLEAWARRHCAELDALAR